jgi:hypothetical protein
MLIYDSASKVLNTRGEDSADVFVEMQRTGGVYPGKFPSLDSRHRRNSAKRRKRDKQVPPHKMTTMMTTMAARFQKMPKIKSHNKQRQQSAGMKGQKASSKGPSPDNSVMKESVTNESPPAEEILSDNYREETLGSSDDDGDEDVDEDVESVSDEEGDDEGSVQQQQQNP